MAFYTYNGLWQYIFVHDRGPQGPTVIACFIAEPSTGLAPLNVNFTNQTYGNYDTSLWDFGDGITSTLTSPTHTYTLTGEYTVTLTASGPGGTDTLTYPSMIATYNRVANLTRTSVASAGSQANDYSDWPTVSADGRFVAYQSLANNLVISDTNGSYDIYVHDRQTRVIERVSVSSNGAQGNSWSYIPTISADGRFVTFEAEANTLVDGDTNEAADIFVHDRKTGETTRVSVASDGTQSNKWSGRPVISADGRYVTFQSVANNLVSGDTDNALDIFVHDRKNGETRRVSVASDGTQSDGNTSFDPAISGDGHRVAFVSYATNLVVSDTNGMQDVFVHDLFSGETTRVSVASDGTQANSDSYAPAISLDGRFVAFTSNASNLVPSDTNNTSDIFVHDLQSGETRRVSLASNGSQANGSSTKSSLSANGRFVTFQSDASNLAGGDTNYAADVFVHDCQTGQTRRVSLASDGSQANIGADWPAISADGQIVVFQSESTNLVSDDTNERKDIFVQDWGIQAPSTVQVDFGASPLSGMDSLTVTFTHHISGEFTFNLWFFGDGETSLQPSPTHTYTTPGVYNVTLFASGPGGTDSLTRNAYIVVRGALSHYIPLVTR